MARPRLDPHGEPVRLCVKIPEALDDALGEASRSRGMTVPEFVRLALAVAVDAVRSGAPRGATGSIEAPGVGRMDYPRAADPRPLDRKLGPCAHKWATKGWGTVCSVCGEVKR